MATITLGNIKFNWKGAYNSSTAYVVDDVVSLSGSSYVCIQAGTNQNPASASAYWEQMSSAGTNGTDLTTTLTTQGDILYRDGSGLQRLGAGTSGQALLTGGAGANPSWGDAGGGVVLQYKLSSDNTSRTQSGNFSNQGFSNTLDNTITPTKVGTKLLLKTSTIKWYTYGAGTLYMKVDGTTVASKAHTNAAYPSSDQTDVVFTHLYTTTSTNQVAVTFTITDGGSGAGSGGFSFGDLEAFLEIIELDI